MPLSLPPSFPTPTLLQLAPSPALLNHLGSTHEFKYSSYHDANGATRAAAEAATAAEAAPKEREAAAPREGKGGEQPAGKDKGEAGTAASSGPTVAQRLKRGVGRVAAAAAETEGLAGADPDSRQGRRAQRAALRLQGAARPAGVLYLNERDALETPAGVLHIVEESGGEAAQVDADAARAQELGVPVGAFSKSRAGDAVKSAGRAIK